MENNINYSHVLEYINNLIPSSDIELELLAEEARKDRIPIIQKEVGELIKVLLKLKEPRRILELGTAVGYSSILMARNSSAIIDTIERNPDMILRAKENINKFALDGRINLLKGEIDIVLDEVYNFYDLIFIDGAKAHYKDNFIKTSKLLNEKGLIICDNVLFKGMVSSENLYNKRYKNIIKNMKEFLKYIYSLENFKTSIIPIGDGLTISVKED